MNQRIEQQAIERKNQRKALAITIVIQGLLFLLFWYAKIWSAEEMKLELPEPGFEVNYGTDDEGGGNVQSYNQASDLPNNDESQPAEKETEVAKLKAEKINELTQLKAQLDNAEVAKKLAINEAVQNGYVGVEELIGAINLEQMLTVAPNPATDFANITLHIPTAAPVSVRVLDAKGGILQARQFGSLQGDFEIGLNTSNYAPGLYIVEMQMNGQRTQKKLVIR